MTLKISDVGAETSLANMVASESPICTQDLADSCA